jgi:hypothetical protein
MLPSLAANLNLNRLLRVGSWNVHPYLKHGVGLRMRSCSGGHCGQQESVSSRNLISSVIELLSKESASLRLE